MNLGDFRLGDTIDFKFTTRQFSSGAPFALAGSPAVAAYPGNSTTEVTGGITLTTSFDSRTGLNHVRIVASSGNGYATATNYEVVITAGTVDSVSVVGEVVARFSIENRSGTKRLAEPSDVFAWPATPDEIQAWLGVTASNEYQETASLATFKSRDGSTTIATADLSDDLTTLKRKGVGE